MDEQPIDLKAALTIIWRKRILLVVLAIVGACGGVAYSVLRPPIPTARALVLLPPSSLTSSGTPTRDMKTEIVLATSQPVLSEAGRAVSPPISATTLAHHVVVTALSQDILQVQASASIASDAEALANAVAADYIRYVGTTDSTSTGQQVAGLQKESATLTHQIQSLQGQINVVSARLATENPNSASGQRDATLLGSLHNEQQQVTLVLDNVNSQIVATQLAGGASAASTRILQQATGVLAPSHLRAVETGAIGLGAGLLLGLVLVLMRAKRARRLWRRSELSQAIGVSVLFSLDMEGYRSTAEWKGLLGHFEASCTDAWGLRRMLLRLNPAEQGEAAAIRLVSFAGDLPALSVGPCLALYASVLGTPTTLEMNRHNATVPLRAAFAAENGAVLRPNLSLVVEDESRLHPASLGSRLVVKVTVVDGEQPALNAFAGQSLLVVSAGFTTAQMLARLGLAAADSGHGLDGIVIVNPEPTDQTAGGVNDGLRASPSHTSNGHRTTPAIAGWAR